MRRRCPRAIHPTMPAKAYSGQSSEEVIAWAKKELAGNQPAMPLRWAVAALLALGDAPTKLALAKLRGFGQTTA